MARKYAGKIRSLVRTDSTRMVLIGRGISTLVVLFLLVDGVVKVLELEAAVEGTVNLGYPASILVWLGIVLLVSTILYAIPRTAILGAILLTGYLGGAAATQVRVGNLLFLFPVLVGVLVWAGLFARDAQLRTLILIRKSNERAQTQKMGEK